MGYARLPYARSPYASGASTPSSLSTPIGPTASPCRLVKDGDYAREDGSTNLATALDPVDQEVAFRVGTIKGTFLGAPEIGNGVTRVRVASSSSLNRARAYVMNALQPMIDRDVIRTVRVTAERVPNAGASILYYRVSYEKTGILEV